ncbi:MAG TPA: hypothetical protein PLS93_17280, partial [Accumulibacter sp.]|nr:hypothetical protein [Accumulibacter sp.]
KPWGVIYALGTRKVSNSGGQLHIQHQAVELRTHVGVASENGSQSALSRWHHNGENGQPADMRSCATQRRLLIANRHRLAVAWRPIAA